mgnify:CR=1 FL=1
MDQPRLSPEGSTCSPAGQPAAKSQQLSTGESIKDTIESILIAFVLAFVFRAFVVEAFVIPTGSMAPTLLGAHMRMTCQACAWQFEVNYSSGTGDGNVPYTTGRGTVLSMHCPNCGYKVPRQSLDDPANDAHNTPVRYGDRILVLKYLYLLRDPARWDVVVFKSPTQQSLYDFTQNYIKRLVGLPGETVMLLDGDVYTLKPGDDSQWQVQTKPRNVQNALWRVVYDNDHFPRQAPDLQFVQPWRAKDPHAGWTIPQTLPEARAFRFDNLAGEGTIFFDRSANPNARKLTDILAYDETSSVTPQGDNYHIEGYIQDRIPHWNVSDVMVRFMYDRRAGDGPLAVSLGKLGDTFTAEFSPQSVRLLKNGQEIRQAALSAKARRHLDVQFMNVDYQVTLYVNDHLMFRTRPEDYAPNVERLMEMHADRQRIARRTNSEPRAVREVFPPPTIEISASRQQATIRHLSLWRDIYYTPVSQDPRLSRADYSHEIQWGRPGRPGDVPGPITLASRALGAAEDEYFVLGDNSILSGDARTWVEPVRLDTEELDVAAGRVPGRFMIGKAFFVYWPAGYRPFSQTMPGIVPNFGDLRFIH